MRKLAIFIGIAVGFILGSCAGRAPYEKLQERVTRLRQKPEVQDTVAAMREEAARRARELPDKVTSKVPSPSAAQV